MKNVPTASKNRKPDVLSGKAIDDKEEKKKALSPNPERGNAVAVPRWSGQLMAAEHLSWQLISSTRGFSPVLIAPEIAAPPPLPVRKEKKHSHGTVTDPAPPSYANPV